MLLKKTTLRATLCGSTLLLVAPLFTQSATAQSAVPQDDGAYGLSISSEFSFDKKTIDVMGSNIAFVDEGSGPVVLFLHGNPTSSYLWRNVIPYVTDGYRAVAPDLIGMGDSDKPNIKYTFEEHAAFLDGFIDELALKDISLVVHDWGSALGMRYARLNPSNVKAMAFMEAIVPPALPVASYEDMGETGELFRTLRTPGKGEAMVLEGNFFVEEVLPNRAPYTTTESRLPTLQ